MYTLKKNNYTLERILLVSVPMLNLPLEGAHVQFRSVKAGSDYKFEVGGSILALITLHKRGGGGAESKRKGT